MCWCPYSSEPGTLHNSAGWPCAPSCSGAPCANIYLLWCLPWFSTWYQMMSCQWPHRLSVTEKQFSPWAMATSGSGWTAGGNKGNLGGGCLLLYLKSICHQVQSRYSVPFESDIWTTNSTSTLHFRRYLWVYGNFPFLRVMQKDIKKQGCPTENKDQN